MKQQTKDATPSPSTPVSIDKEAENEVRFYTDLPITLIDEPFAKNHLFCVRGKHCEFAEYQNFVHVYIYPSLSIDKEVLEITGKFKTWLSNQNMLVINELGTDTIFKMFIDDLLEDSDSFGLIANMIHDAERAAKMKKSTQL